MLYNYLGRLDQELNTFTLLMLKFTSTQSEDHKKAQNISLKNFLNKIIGNRFSLPQDVVEYNKKRAFVEQYVQTTIRPLLPNPSILESTTVGVGYFQGLKFGELLNLQAGIVQKLFGVYEVELTDELKTLEARKYDWIINIGAAEGLYSMAFSNIWKNIPVYSFEQDFCTRQLLKQMIKLNETPNVITLGEFNLSDVSGLAKKGKGLIFSDCEGYEKVLFSSETANCFENHDLVVETHDHLVQGSHQGVADSLSKSHSVKNIDQLTLQPRCERVADEQFRKLDVDTQCKLLDESRHIKNSWIIALS